MTLIYEKFEAFFELHAEWEEFFLECEIEGFGTLEQFIDVCHVYHRITHVDVVLGGSASECVIIQALEEAFLNESFSLSTRQQIQQIKVKLEAYFVSETDVYLRMGYVSAQLYQFYKLFDIKALKAVDRITLGEWGSIFDLRFCASFFKNHGWDFGAETTVEASTAEADLSCVKRGPLITIGSGCNCTTLTDSVNAAFNTWPRGDKANFNSYKKRIETLIWGNEYPATSDKIAQIVTVFNGCSTPGTSTYTLVMGTEITGWGNVKKFTDCQNAPNHD
ncbi:hypothetical protein AAVH_28199 [Aphelenchoides avenae]|nr:hypothetical protein AAVH_28199 [Aphelenchus avenae]